MVPERRSTKRFCKLLASFKVAEVNCDSELLSGLVSSARFEVFVTKDGSMVGM